jgi:hypothetical protein
MHTRFDLSSIGSCSEIPACRGPEVLSLLIEIDPVGDDGDEKRYPERVENFSGNYIWRKMTGDITIEFLEAAVERMFTADEVPSVLDLAKLKELKHRIVHLFLYAKETGRNRWD